MLLLSAQRALLGAINSAVVGVTIEMRDLDIRVRAYITGDLSEDERETFDAATAEIVADFSHARSIDIDFIEWDKEAIREDGGYWVFLRYGYNNEA